MNPKLSVVIPIHSKDAQGLALTRLTQNQDRMPSSVEVILIFNPKIPRTALALDLGIQVRVFCEPMAGVNRARNLGAVQAKAEWVYFLDSDCWPTSEVPFEDVLELLPTLDPSKVYGGPYQLLGPSTPVSEAYQILQSKWLKDGEHPDHGWVHLLGGNMLVSKDILTRHLFDPEIVFGGAETDFLAKWIAQGQKAAYLHMPVDHFHQLTLWQLKHKAFLQGFGFERLVQRGLLVRKFKKTIRTVSDNLNIERAIQKYDEVFGLGREYYRDVAKTTPSKFERNFYILKKSLLNKFTKNSKFGSELDRLVRPDANS